MKIAQISGALTKGDSISNVVLADHEIEKDAGMGASIILDLVSEYGGNDIYEMLSLDVSSFSLRDIPSFMQTQNKLRCAKLFAKAMFSHSPHMAEKKLEEADIRVWHSSGFLRSSYLIHRRDIFYFYNYTAPYMREYYSGSTEMRSRLELLMHNDLDLTYITSSQFNKETLDKLGVRYAGIRILPLFHRYALEYSVHEHSIPRLLAYGRYAKSKNIPELCKVCNETGMKLKHFGDLSLLSEHANQYRQALQYKCDNIELYGKVQEIGPFFSSSNILVSNSTYEGFCLPAVEAMAHSLPVLLRSGSAMDEFFDKAELQGLRIGYKFDSAEEIPELAERIIKDYGRISHDAWVFSHEYTLEKYKAGYLSCLKKVEKWK